MARTFPGDGQTYYRHAGGAVLNLAGTGPMPNLPGGQVKVNGAVVSVREVQSGALTATVQTSGIGYFPDILVPIADPVNDVVAVDWPDDGIDPQTISMDVGERVALLTVAAQAAGADAASVAQGAVLSAAQAQAQAAAAAVAAAAAQAAAEAAAANPGTGGGGVVVVTSEAQIWAQPAGTLCAYVVG